MPLATLTKAEEYLATSYRPDQEWLDGQLLERNVGEFDHSNLQRALMMLLCPRERKWNMRVLPEQRMRVSSSRFRVPDICVISREQAIEPVLISPPLVCIEVLSKNDSLTSMQERIDDYLAFGVKDIWVLDPVKRRAYFCQSDGIRNAGADLIATASAVRISLAELFSLLD